MSGLRSNGAVWSVSEWPFCQWISTMLPLSSVSDINTLLVLFVCLLCLVPRLIVQHLNGPRTIPNEHCCGEHTHIITVGLAHEHCGYTEHSAEVCPGNNTLSRVEAHPPFPSLCVKYLHSSAVLIQDEISHPVSWASISMISSYIGREYQRNRRWSRERDLNPHIWFCRPAPYQSVITTRLKHSST